MKRLLLLLPLLLLAACLNVDERGDADRAEAAPDAEQPAFESYGTFTGLDDGQGVLTADAVVAEPLTYADSTVRVEGTVAQVCQKKGCWVTFQGEEPGTNLRIMVPRDDEGQYVYTFPMDLGPVRMVVEGTVEVTEMDPETVAHYEAEGATVPPAGDDGIVRQVMLVASGAMVEAAPPEDFVTPEPPTTDEA
ncbi:MAG: DUF4920 domain-containing protein [Bacteroidota bacterium]